MEKTYIKTIKNDIEIVKILVDDVENNIMAILNTMPNGEIVDDNGLGIYVPFYYLIDDEHEKMIFGIKCVDNHLFVNYGCGYKNIDCDEINTKLLILIIGEFFSDIYTFK